MRKMQYCNGVEEKTQSSPERIGIHPTKHLNIPPSLFLFILQIVQEPLGICFVQQYLSKEHCIHSKRGKIAPQNVEIVLCRYKGI